MSMLARRVSLFLENLLRRDKYLNDLNRRIHYFKDKQPVPSPRVIDEPAGDASSGEFVIPEIPAAELDQDFLRSAMRSSGCCLVRGFLSPDEVEEIRAYIDHSFALKNGNSSVHRYMSKMADLEQVLEATREDIEKHRETNETYSDTVKLVKKSLSRAFGADTTELTATSPMLANKLLRLFEKKGLKRLLSEYFGNDPCVSVYKWVFRKSVSPKQVIDFHQDGAFMGDYINSLNCWVPLTDCGKGTDLPGMDIVPVRLLQTFAKGSGVMNWTITPQAVIDEYGEGAIVTPDFRQGDAFFFDHCLVHRTQYAPDAPRERYALETWFFDSGNFPKNQIPIQW